MRLLPRRRPTTSAVMPVVEPAVLMRSDQPLLEALPDDLLCLILSLVPNAHALSAAACASQRLHALTSDALPWHLLLCQHLSSASWPQVDLKTLEGLSKADAVHALLSPAARRPWALSRAAPVANDAGGGAASVGAASAGAAAAPASPTFSLSASGFPVPTSNPFLLAAAAAAASFTFHQPPATIYQPAHALASIMGQSPPLAVPTHAEAPPGAAASSSAAAPGALSLPPSLLGAGASSSSSQPSATILPPPPTVAPAAGTHGHAAASTSASSARAHGLHPSADGLAVSFVGERLGGNRAVRCEPPLPTQPFDCLLTVTSSTPSDEGEGSKSNQVGEGDDSDATAAPRLSPGPRDTWRLRLARSCVVAYFEVTIGHVPPSQRTSIDCIAVGVGASNFPLCGRQPGWDASSYGYHSDDGRLFHGSGTRSEPFGPRFGPGDTVGCGFCLRSRQIFYSLNGKFLGVAFVAKASHLPLYPLVGLDSHAPVHFNFGQRPFRYDTRNLPPTVGHTGKTKSEAGPPSSPLRQLALAFSRS